MAAPLASDSSHGKATVVPAARRNWRRLGLAVAGMWLDGVALDGAVCAGGFYPAEAADLRWTDGQARLWPQTERLKASLALAAIFKGEERQRFSGHALHSALALWGYIDGLLPGLWRDKLRKDGQFVCEPAPASTFYHIICALTELDRFIKTQ